MPRFAYVVYSNPVPGREDEYNDWYSNRHLAEVTAVPGFISAQRFRLMNDTAEGTPPQRYMAIYNMETENAAGAVSRLTALVENGAIMMSEAFTMEGMAIQLYEAITPVVHQKQGITNEQG